MDRDNLLLVVLSRSWLCKHNLRCNLFFLLFLWLLHCFMWLLFLLFRVCWDSWWLLFLFWLWLNELWLFLLDELLWILLLKIFLLLGLWSVWSEEVIQEAYDHYHEDYCYHDDYNWYVVCLLVKVDVWTAPKLSEILKHVWLVPANAP